LRSLAAPSLSTILAYVTFGGSMFGAIYLLNDKPIQSLAAELFGHATVDSMLVLEQSGF
jgi:hypothetical protein